MQHWWHEPGGQGVRTRFSDDRLWLVYATLQYVKATGDDAVLDEQVPFLEGRLLNARRARSLRAPVASRARARRSTSTASARSRSVSQTGAHGLPLMGTGDWNDGMNLVGAEGRGESVWLGWFLVSLLRSVRRSRRRARRARSRRARIGDMRSASPAALDAAWDGDWYRRAYFDDGTPLGSKENTECHIDAIAQSWAVISGGGDPTRARQAMESDRRPPRSPERRLILLLTPPFDKTDAESRLHPGLRARRA